ncbi:MAG TPA: hypothetical protein VIF62_00500 [Labilithrix sp.]|jgi:hypothetical protein
MQSARVRKGLFVIGIVAAALTSPSLAGATPADHAAAPSQGASSPGGTWSWFFKPKGQIGHDMTLVMKADGGAVNGTITFKDSAGTQARVVHGTLKGDAIEFAYDHEVNGVVHHYRYVATVGANTMTGRLYYPRNGEEVSQNWIAKRTK